MTFKNILCRTIFYSMLFKNGFLTISRKLENSVTLFFGVNDDINHTHSIIVYFSVSLNAMLMVLKFSSEVTQIRSTYFQNGGFKTGNEL